MAGRFKYPIKRSPKSDPQQYRVYRMENEAIGARNYMRTTRSVLRGLAISVCRNYRVPMAKLKWADLGKWAAEWHEGIIRLNKHKGSSSDILTITHELAHHVHHHLSDGRDVMQEAHGAEFMACHISILDSCRIIPVVGMRAVCGAWKIEYHDPGTTSSLKKLRRICLGPRPQVRNTRSRSK